MPSPPKRRAARPAHVLDTEDLHLILSSLRIAEEDGSIYAAATGASARAITRRIAALEALFKALLIAAIATAEKNP